MNEPRPRVLPGLPVLRRGRGEIQVGVDPRHAAVVSGLPDAVVTAAGELTAGLTESQLLAGLPVPDRSVLRELLHLLADAGLVSDAVQARALPPRLAADATLAALRPVADADTRASCSVLVHGAGRLAATVAVQLAAAGVGRVHVCADGQVGPEHVGTCLGEDDIGLPFAEAVHAAARRVDASVRTSRFIRSRPDLVLLTDALAPDPQLLGELRMRGQPHLQVRARDGLAMVGPLVVPGLSSCLTCVHLHRTDLDPSWPTVAAQLAGRVHQADLATTQACTALAVAQTLDVLRWQRHVDHRPLTWNASIELDIFAGTSTRRGVPPHPACRCGGVQRQTG